MATARRRKHNILDPAPRRERRVLTENGRALSIS
jgi:hypothetical protein